MTVKARDIVKNVDKEGTNGSRGARANVLDTNGVEELYDVLYTPRKISWKKIRSKMYLLLRHTTVLRPGSAPYCVVLCSIVLPPRRMVYTLHM